MLAGDASSPEMMVIVGIERYYDFFPGLIAGNLEAQGISALGVKLDLPCLRDKKTLTSRILAKNFENPEFREEVVQTLKTSLQGIVKPGQRIRIGFPAVLGLIGTQQIIKDLQDELGCAIFEIPGLPPSIPGMRLHQILSQAVQKAGGVIYEGMQVVKADCSGNQVHTVWSEAAARLRPHQADHVVLATGGILGGGIVCSLNATLSETIFGLWLQSPPVQESWLRTEFLAEGGHPLFRRGILVDSHFCPLDSQSSRQFENLSVIGSTLAFVDPIQERSLEGISLATGFSVGEMLGEVKR
jgi:glycerol-3-phosphate dehydrogenase subunit B